MADLKQERRKREDYRANKMYSPRYPIHMKTVMTLPVDECMNVTANTWKFVT